MPSIQETHSSYLPI